MPFRPDLSGHSRRSFLLAAAGTPLLPAAAPPERSTPGNAERPSGPLLPPDTTGPYAGKRWNLQYMLDEDESSAVLNDLRFASPTRGIAACALTRRGRQDPGVLITRDGGRTWTPVRMRDFILSLCLVDETRAFAVGEDHLWYSAEAGASWERRKLPPTSRSKGLRAVRVSFIDDQRGWAFGLGKVFYLTEDGGRSWQKVPESEAITLKDENTVWSWMTWVTPKAGMIVGASAAPPKDATPIPDWMLPERSTRRRALPASTVLAETRDGGKTWVTSVASTFGRAARIRSRGLRGLTVFEYGEGIEFPSEVFDLDLRTGKSQSLFCRKDVVVHDVAPLASGGAILAAIEPAGRLRSSPVPGHLRIFHTPDGTRFSEMKVDYRAVGRRAELAYVDDDHLWAATDEGMILHLT